MLAVLIGLMFVVLGALGVPFAASHATSQGQALFVDRVSDTSRFASIAQQVDSVEDLPLVRTELERYDELYGIAAAVVGMDGQVRVASRARPGLDGESAQRRVRVALAGRPSQPPGAVWPWTAEPLVVAVPMVRGGGVIGAVATVSPVERTRTAVLRGWGMLALGEAVALVGGVVLALRTTRWVLRPVDVLDAATHEIATGRLAARVAEGGGPPELRRLASSFNEMADHVEQVVERQRAFVADASHQLRNPLNALLLRLDDLAMRLPEPWAPEVSTAADEGRGLARALDSLLELARVEHAGAEPEVVDVVPVVDRRISAWVLVAQRRGITLTRTGARSARALVSPEALQGVLDVVLDNAVKFAPEGSRVVVDVSAGDGEAVVAVNDEGPGLDDEELARAGDRFWRSRRHQNVDGSGLGLAIARSLISPSGGRLEVRANAPRGLSVLVRLCISRKSGQADEQGSASCGQGLISR
jgi:signal transduction histidine kinase